MSDKEKIFAAYDKFHKAFQGDVQSLSCGHICEKCETNCEVCAKDDEVDFKYVLSFLPFELEYVAGKMNIPLQDFRDQYAYGIETDESIIDVMKFEKECPFLRSDFSCGMGETKIIACKIFPIIHYPMIEFAFSGHCELTRDPAVRKAYTDGIVHYKELLDTVGATPNYRFLRECFDILQLAPGKADELIRAKKFKTVKLETLKTYLIAEPSCI